MEYKYCAVAMGKGVNDFKDMVDFAAADGYKIGTVAGDQLLIATFISTFTKFEVYNILEGVANINFVLTEVDNMSVKFQTHNLENKLLGIFNEMSKEAPITKAEPFEIKVIKKTQEEIERDFDSIKKSVTEEFETKVKDMTPKEKQGWVDEILDRVPDLSSRDKILLELLTK